MCAEALSQDEIDALLRGQSNAASEDEAALPPEEHEAVALYAGLFRSACTDVWSKLLGQEVKFDVEALESLAPEQLPARCPEDAALLRLKHGKHLQGSLLMVLPVTLATALGGALTGTGGQFGELEQSALGEGQSQVFAAVCAQLAQKLKLTTQVQATPAEVCRNSDALLAEEAGALGEPVVAVFLRARAGEVSGPLILAFSHTVIAGLMRALVEPEKPRATQARRETGQARAVHPAVFDEFPSAEVKAQPPNLSFILDIGLEVRVELGRTSMRVKEVLELGPGAVIELDKLAGEPVDLLVNDKLFARGEVVVIDENFGVRVTDIVNIKDRIEAMGEA